MTSPQPADNPSKTPNAGPSRALWFIRLAIALTLLVGVSVLGVSATRDLMAAMDNPAGPTQPGSAHDTLHWETPGDGNGTLAQSQGDNPASLGPNYRPLERDPGNLAPLPGSIREFAHMQKPTNGLTEESAHYLVAADPLDVIDHYQEVAKQAGFHLVKPPRPVTQRPMGMNLQMQRGQQTLSVNAWPTNPDQPAQTRPPLKPVRPLSVTVILQYPVTAQPPH